MSDTKELLKHAGELADGDKPSEAVEICNRVLLDEPDHPGALYIIGCVLLKGAAQVQGIQIAKRICEVAPKDPRGYGLLATFWGELHRYDESIRCAEKALACKRTDKTLADACYAHTNAGNWEQAAKYGEEALATIERDPSPMANEAMTNCRVSMGYIRLAQGRWVEGFEGFRATMRTKWRKERDYTAADGGQTKEWQGEPDAKVIVTTEQGLGDEIMAAGMVPDAKCDKFILDCDARLAALFTRSFPNVHVTGGRREAALRLPPSVGLPTHHKTLFGLGEILRQKDSDFHRRPYLIPNAEYVGMFKELFGGQKVIGLAWSGGLPRTGEVQRKAGLNAFLPLIRRGGAEFVSLEYRHDGEEAAAFEKQHGLRVKRLPWATMAMDMDLLAGLIGACDEVIGVGTTAIHVSSALGVPTTILANKGLGWAFARDEMLWYPPTTKIWRKHAGQSWRECVAALAESRKGRMAA